jgi:hypothetical protein
MPYVSKAQARAFHAKLRRGEISASTVKEFDQSTDFSHLPEHSRRANPVRKARKRRKET